MISGLNERKAKKEIKMRGICFLLVGLITLAIIDFSSAASKVYFRNGAQSVNVSNNLTISSFNLTTVDLAKQRMTSGLATPAGKTSNIGIFANLSPGSTSIIFTDSGALWFDSVVIHFTTSGANLTNIDEFIHFKATTTGGLVLFDITLETIRRAFNDSTGSSGGLGVVIVAAPTGQDPIMSIRASPPVYIPDMTASIVLDVAAPQGFNIHSFILNARKWRPGLIKD